MTMTMTAKKTTKPRLQQRSFSAWFHRQTRAAKAAIGIMGALGMMVTAMLAVDSRYASANDVNKLGASIELSQLANEIAILNLRKSAVMDRVHNYVAKERATGGRLHPVERAQLQRDQAEVADIDRQIDDKMRRHRERTRGR